MICPYRLGWRFCGDWRKRTGVKGSPLKLPVAHCTLDSRSWGCKKLYRLPCPRIPDRGPSWSVWACKWTWPHLNIPASRSGTYFERTAVTGCPAIVGFPAGKFLRMCRSRDAEDTLATGCSLLRLPIAQGLHLSILNGVRLDAVPGG